ncbi:hypothetical protein A4A49_52483 [Nicotiana attenuata]|uniref:Uncharacterized protein n=1 Tax=Nicotiana attenuata TaxID=49451 RepID=A0A1J6KTU2_NICAT|nr:hypothetical protein A4A49_52483 [Nicotiana attenuata]
MELSSRYVEFYLQKKGHARSGDMNINRYEVFQDVGLRPLDKTIEASQMKAAEARKGVATLGTAPQLIKSLRHIKTTIHLCRWKENSGNTIYTKLRSKSFVDLSPFFR